MSTKTRGYGQFCPVAKASEVIAERWTLLVLRELLGGSHRFNDLQRGVPLMSRSLLSKRLKELEDAGIVERRTTEGKKNAEYHLTEAGHALRPIIIAIGLWGREWIQTEIDEADLDPDLLMWDIRRCVDPSVVDPEQRLVVQFDLTGVPTKKSRWWLLFEGGQADLCLQPPGHDVDLYVSSSIRALTNVWMGHTPLASAVKSGAVTLDGSRRVCADFRKWFALNQFARMPS